MSPTGDRWVVPVKPLRAFLLEADLGGMALLAADPSLDWRFRSNQGNMRLLWQHGPRVTEHLNRRFLRESDLYVPRTAGAGVAATHILPDALDSGMAGRRKRSKPGDLLAEGRREAAAGGDLSPEPAKCIRLGLLAAARRNPIDPHSLKAEQALSLVRGALFDAGPDPAAADDKVVEHVLGRFVDLLEKHREDELAAFNEWMFEDVDNIVHGIAKRRTDGGPIVRTEARQAHLELIWSSFVYLAQTVDAQMRAFSSVLPFQLSDREAAVFNTIYLRQDHFGGLPLVMLFDRFEFLREAIQDVWNNPGDSAAIGALLRMLDFYREMVDNRRSADSRHKARSTVRNVNGRIATEQELKPERDAAADDVEDDFQPIAAVLRRQRGASCRCPNSSQWRAFVPKGELSDPISFEDTCGSCGHSESVTVAWHQIRVAKNMVGD